VYIKAYQASSAPDKRI